MRRFPFNHYAYAGVPPQEEEVFYTYNPRTRAIYYTDDPYAYFPVLVETEQPEVNYDLDTQIIDQIAFRVLTRITVYKPRKKVEISPVTRMKLHL